MSSNDKINELRKKEKEMQKIFEEMKLEKKAETVEQIRKYLMDGETDKAKTVIEKLENLKELTLETNIRMLNQLEEQVTMENEEINYEQLKMDNERKEEMKIIDDIFVEQLEKRGFVIEDHSGNMKKVNKNGQILYFFEINDEQNLIEEIENKMKYTGLLIGVKTMEKEGIIVDKINKWLESTSIDQKQTMKKYLSINVTSQERLNKDMDSIKKIKIA